MHDFLLTPAEVAALDQGRARVADNMVKGVERLQARLASDEWSDVSTFRDMVVEFLALPHSYCAAYLAECMWKLAVLMPDEEG